jgi:hypothetical protein
MASKYHNKRCVIDGIKFDSLVEGQHYAELKIRERAGEITELTVHPRYPIIINKRQVCIVELDFSYRDKEGHTHFIDCKGMDTALSKLKRKLVLACHGVAIELVRRKRR